MVPPLLNLAPLLPACLEVPLLPFFQVLALRNAQGLKAGSACSLTRLHLRALPLLRFHTSVSPISLPSRDDGTCWQLPRFHLDMAAGQYLGSGVLAAAFEPDREPGWTDDGSCPRAGLDLGKPLAVVPSLRLRMPPWREHGPGTWSHRHPWQGSGSDFPTDRT